jgi:ferredoxin
MRVRVDPRRCCSAGLCVLAVPEVFGQSDDDGTVRLLAPAPERGLWPAVARAAARCPSGAITVAEGPGPGR